MCWCAKWYWNPTPFTDANALIHSLKHARTKAPKIHTRTESCTIQKSGSVARFAPAAHLLLSYYVVAPANALRWPKLMVGLALLHCRTAHTFANWLTLCVCLLATRVLPWSVACHIHEQIQSADWTVFLFTVLPSLCPSILLLVYLSDSSFFHYFVPPFLYSSEAPFLRTSVLLLLCFHRTFHPYNFSTLYLFLL